MKSFNEWLDTTKLRGYMDENSLEAAYEAGQQSKQDEVDELRKMIDDLEKNKLCIQNLVKKLNIAESKLNKIAIQAQKKLETFGSALRFKDTVQNILKGYQ